MNQTRLGSLGEGVCLLCALGFCGLILFQCLTRAAAPLGAVVLAGAVCAGVVLWLGGRVLLPTGTALAGLFLLRFAIALGVIFLVGGQPVQDFQTMYAAAQELARGEHGYLDQLYFFNWAYQTGFVAYEALVLTLFGPGQLPLQIMNALWMAGTGCLVYLLALEFLPRSAAQRIALLYAVYPAPYFLAAVLTNQHLAVFLFYLAFYLLVRPSVPRLLAAGGLLALGNAVRALAAVLLLAAVLWLLIGGLLNKERGRDCLMRCAALAGTYFLVFALLSFGIKASGMNPEGLSNNQPMWKFVLGLCQESNGSWNRADYDAYLSLPTQEADAAMREAVKDRLSAGPVRLAGLAVRKSGVMWGADEYMYWGFGHLDPQAGLGPLTINQWTQVLARGDKGVYILAFALALVGFWSWLRDGTRGGLPLLLTLVFCGYYAVHLIIEVQSRYRYFLMPAVFLAAGAGLMWLWPERNSRSRRISF